MSTKSTKEFQKKIWDYYNKFGRHTIPWRRTRDPYKILVSEVMLQQTQVSRVIDKYKEFLDKYPDFSSLATTPQADVVKMWLGLGYNRRAVYLKRSAEMIVNEFQGTLPDSEIKLVKLPGIGQYTAGALIAFTYNKPAVFIETNIRRVIIHELFHDKENISDKQLLPVIKKTMDRKDPRHWYYALMDYGHNLGKNTDNANKRSRHYTKQSRFKGSKREVRGIILKMLSEQEYLSTLDINKIESSHDISEIVKQLEKENLIRKNKNNQYTLA